MKHAIQPSLTTQHVRFDRRTAIQAGAIGLLNLGMNHVDGLRALAARRVGWADRAQVRLDRLPFGAPDSLRRDLALRRSSPAGWRSTIAST